MARSSRTSPARAAAILGFASLAGLIVDGGAARADDWISAEMPAAVALSAPQSSYFTAGAMPSIAGYVPVSGHVAVGLRMRFGALGDASAHGMNMVNPGRGGLAEAALAVRFDAGATWIELDGGGGMTGSDAVPTFEVGVGHTFGAGTWTYGPIVRYLRVMAGSSPLSEGDAGIVLAGLELQVGRGAPRPPRPSIDEGAEPAPALPPMPDRAFDAGAIADEACHDPSDPTAVGCSAHDRDADGIPDDLDRCPDQPETVNGVDDADGCPDEGLFVVQGDRIVLDERVLFDLNRARVKHAGKRVIAAIARAWSSHPEWTHMTIQGHADLRGPDEYNDWLSGERAARVRQAMIDAGVPTDCIDAVGFGKRRPIDPGTSEEAHQRNRRVEFVIVRGGAR